MKSGIQENLTTAELQMHIYKTEAEGADLIHWGEEEADDTSWRNTC